MKNMLLASAATSALFYSLPVQAQECTAAPDCSTLGYTKTASQCSGKTFTRCPFDPSKYSCAETANVDCAALGYTDEKSQCPGNFVTCPSNASAVRCLLDAKPGDLKYSLRTGDHDGWLLCNGTSYNKKEWPELYAVIGETFGTSRPNYSGYFLKGAATSAASTFKTAEQAGLPNITGQITGLRNEGVNVSGAIQMTYGSASGKHSSGGSKYTFTFDASKTPGNTVYGKSSTVTPANYKANIFIFAGRKMANATTCEKSGYLSTQPKGSLCSKVTVGSTTCYKDCNSGSVLEKCKTLYPDTAYNADTRKPYPNSTGFCYDYHYDDCGNYKNYYSSDMVSDYGCKAFGDELVLSCDMAASCMSTEYGL